MKLLISAYACSPYQGSEPGVGWGFINELSMHHKLHVICESRYKKEISEYLYNNPSSSVVANVKFYFLNRDRNFFLEKVWPPSYYWTYREWHQEAFNLSKILHSEHKFDAAHQLTMVGFREPGYLWKLGIPFVWGPVGGMGYFPKEYFSSVGLYGSLYFKLYNFFNYLQMNFATRPRKAAKYAGKGLIGATTENIEGFHKYWNNDKAMLISEVGLPPSRASKPNSRREGEALRIVWSGQHIPGKALNLALEAVAQLPEGCNWELNILGEGKLTNVYKKLANELCISDKVHFHGRIPREQALLVMQKSHLMVITSLRDLTSTVVIEALANGLPVISLNHCGFHDVVDNTCGIKIELTHPESTVLDIKESIYKIECNEQLRRELSAGAINRATEYEWSNKIVKLNSLYDSIVDGKRVNS